MKRKLTAALLALCIVLSLLPGTVFAQGEKAATNMFQVTYDMSGGTVFWGRGTIYPEGTEEDFLADGEWTTAVNKANTVHFLLDTTRAADWDAWNQNGELVCYDPWQAEDRSVNVRVEYPTEDSWYRADALVGGQVMAEGFTYENGILSFKAEAAQGEVYVSVWWTDHDFQYFTFEPVEGQILIDYQWNGPGQPAFDSNVTVLDSCDQPNYNRGRILVPDTTPSVTFSWTGHLKQLWVEGEQDENGWGHYSVPDFQTYTYVLDRVNENNDPWNHYGINFDFFWDWNCQIRACYDVWGGSVYMSLGDELPGTEPAELLFDDVMESFETDGQIRPVHLRFDQEHGLDRGRYEQDGTVQSVDSNVAPEDRALFVFGEYVDANGEDVRDWVVEAGEAVMPGFSFADNVLSFTPETGCDIRLEVFWSEAEYEFRNYDWDENSVLIEFNAWGGGTVHWDEGVDVGNLLQPDYGRGKIRVPLDTPQLSFTWDGHLRTLSVTGLEGEWERTEWNEPDFDSYTLILNQTENDGSPRRHYWIDFDFADESQWNYLFAANYDDNGGSVYYGVNEAPEMQPEAYLPRQGNGRDGWPDNISYEVNGAPGDIYLCFDPSRCIDFDAWDQGEFVLQDAWESDDRSISVVAKYEGLDGNWHEEPIVLFGQAVSPRATYDGSVMRFTPESGYGVDFDIYWTFEDYYFSQFRPTEDKPVMVEVNWWGDGSVSIVDELPEEDVMTGNGRMRVRLSREVSSLTLEWGEDDELRCVNVNGLGENGDWLNGIVPEGGSYTLVLNQVDDWGNPRDWYHIQFEFEGSSMPYDGTVRVFYDQNGGSVFRTLDYENYPEATAEYYQFDGDMGTFCYLNAEGETRDVRLLIDETKAIDWELWDQESEIGFVQPNQYEQRNLIVCVRSNHLDGVVVWDGNTTEYGEYKGFHFSAENVLSFGGVDGTSDMEIKIYWTEADYRFDNFHGTEEAPVVIQVDWWGDGQISLPEVPEEDLYQDGNRARIRVPWETESLTFTWDENDPLRQINVNGIQGWDDWYNDVPFEGNSYTLELNATWDNGDPKDWYHIQFEFEDGPGMEEGMMISFYDQGKGSIFWALGEEELVTDPTHYLGFGFDRAVSFMEDGEVQPVRLFFDETQAGFFDENGELTGFGDAMELTDRALTLWIETEDWNGKIIDNGVLTDLGQEHSCSFENNVLSLIPENRWLLFHVDWCVSDTVFDEFQPTEEFPVIVEYNYYNYGEIIPPAGIAAENILIQPGRARMRVAADTGSLTFTWAENYGVNRVSWSDVNYDDAWHDFWVDQSEPHSFTLYLDNEADHGVNHYYILDFEFFPDSRYQLWVNWCGSEGNVYYGLNEVPEIDIANYIFEAPSYLVIDEQGNESIGTVYLRLDHEHSIAFFDENPTELYDLGDWEGYDPSVWIEYPHEDGTWFEGFVVRHGQAVAEGFHFENDVLSFTPENEQPVIVYVYWSDDDLDFQRFDGTDEKPVVVEAMLGSRAPVELPADVPAEDMLVWHAAEHDYVKLRLPADQQSVSFGWAREGVIGLIEVDGAGPDGSTLEIHAPKGTSYTLMLNQQQWGSPRQYYRLTFWAFGWPENPFIDVPEDAWYREAVILMKISGVTAGTTPVTFSPNKAATRAQVVTFLWRVYGSQEPETRDCPFTDVAEDAWYRDAVLWAVENGITFGTSETTFSPNKACKREEVVTFLWRAAGSPAPETQDCRFTDVPENAWYADAVCWALEKGITAGTSETSFSPKKVCTRAEIAMFLYRVMMYNY